MSIKKLAGQTMLYGLSSVVAKTINAFMGILLTYLLGDNRAGMADMGSYSLLYAGIAVANIIYTFGFETGYFRFVNQPGTEEKSIFRTTAGSLFLSSTLFSLLLIASSVPLSHFLEIGHMPELITIIAGIIFLDTVAAIPFARLRYQEKPLRYAVVRISGILIYIASTITFLYFLPVYGSGSDNALVQWLLAQDRVKLIFIANLLQALFTVLVLLPQFGGFSLKLDWTVWRSIVRYSAPMIVIGLAGMVNELMDRFFLQYWLPGTPEDAQVQVGLYSANYRIAIFISLFIQAFRMGAEPFFFKSSQDKNAPQTYALVMKWFVVTLCVAFLFSALYVDIIAKVNKGNYQDGRGIIPVVLMANVFLGIYYNLSIWYKVANKMYWGILITLLGAVVTVSVCYTYIPVYGIYAPAWATLLCYVVMVVVAYFSGKRYYPVPYAVGRILLYLSLAVLLFGLQYLGKEYLFGWVHPLWYSFLSGTVLILLFLLIVVKKEGIKVASLLRSLRKK